MKTIISIVSIFAVFSSSALAAPISGFNYLQVKIDGKIMCVDQEWVLSSKGNHMEVYTVKEYNQLAKYSPNVQFTMDSTGLKTAKGTYVAGWQSSMKDGGETWLTNRPDSNQKERTLQWYRKEDTRFHTFDDQGFAPIGAHHDYDGSNGCLTVNNNYEKRLVMKSFSAPKFGHALATTCLKFKLTQNLNLRNWFKNN